MVKGAVVGKAGTPFTTFVGVLYAAQMRHSAGEGYRFSVSAQALGPLGRVYGSLQQGEFPQGLSEDEFARVAFQMDFPNSLSRRILPFGRGKAERDLPELELTVVPLLESGSRLAPGTAGWAGLVDAALLVIVVEAPSVEPSQGAAAADAGLASLVSSLRAESRGDLSPRAALVWWLPGPPPASVAKDKTETPAIPPPSQPRPRAALGEKLAAARLPATLSALEAAGAKGAPESFFAWVRTEVKAGVPRVARRHQFEVGGVEPDYPYDELAALIEHLGRLAS